MNKGNKVKGLFLILLLCGMLILILMPGRWIQGILFSPGRGVHEEVADCTACHIPFRQAQGCDNMACHPLIPSIFRSGADFKFHTIVAGQGCTTCHSEHAGRTDSYSGRIFKHDFFVESKEKNCINCHQLPQDAVHSIAKKQSNCLQCHTYETWTPTQFNHNELPGNLTAECVSCHTEPAGGNHILFGSRCNVCHSTKAWKPAAFQHEGLNDKGWISCGICHGAPRDEDHRGVGNNCAACHDISSW